MNHDSAFAGVAAVGLAVAGLNVWLYFQGESG